jgi:hypothetical protein
MERMGVAKRRANLGCYINHERRWEPSTQRRPRLAMAAIPSSMPALQGERSSVT